MADEMNPETPTENPPAETPGYIPGTGHADAEPDKSGGLVSKDRYDALQEQVKAYQDTLKALQGAVQRPTVHANQPIDPAESVATALKQRGIDNADPGEVRKWLTFLEPVFELFAKPYVNALVGMADRFEGLEVRSEIPEYKDFSTEVDQLRAERQASNQYITRKEAFHIVRSRNIGKIIEGERAKAEHDVREKFAAAGQGNATDLGSGTSASASPRPGQSRKITTAEDFARLTPEEKEAYLSNASF